MDMDETIRQMWMDLGDSYWFFVDSRTRARRWKRFIKFAVGLVIAAGAWDIHHGRPITALFVVLTCLCWVPAWKDWNKLLRSSDARLLELENIRDSYGWPLYRRSSIYKRRF
jgi:hypothetical protein